jgi:hypothetical protein
MNYIIAGIIVILAICGIVKAVGGDRYASMTEEEFEEEAKRSSRTGGMVSALQKIVDPSHHVEYVQEQQERVEADGAESGGPPKPVAPALPAPRTKG